MPDLSAALLGTGSGSNTQPSFTVTAPTNGRLVVAFVGKIGSATQSANTGWTRLTVGTNGSSSTAATYWKIAGAGESTTQQPATFSATTGSWHCDIYEVTSAALGFPANPVGAENATSQAATTSVTTPSITPTAGLEGFVVVGWNTTATGGTFSAEAVSGSGVGAITEGGDSNGGASARGLISATTGAYAGSATQSSSRSSADAIAIFVTNAAPTDTAPPPFSRPWRIWHPRRAA